MGYSVTAARIHDQDVKDALEQVRLDLLDIHTKYAALVAKLDADTGVTDTNYAATVGLAAAKLDR